MVYTIVCFLFKLSSIGRIEVFITLFAFLLTHVSGFRVGQLGESVAEKKTHRDLGIKVWYSWL